MKLMTFLIWIAQLVAHIGDFIGNDNKNLGVILMIAIVCHLLND